MQELQRVLAATDASEHGLSAVVTGAACARRSGASLDVVSVLETRFPLRVRRYAVRRGSGGAGRRPGGDGLIREFEFLAPATGSLLTERRRHAPWGLAGGGPGKPGENRLNGEVLPGKCELRLQPGDRLVVETPGGGGYALDATDSSINDGED